MERWTKIVENTFAAVAFAEAGEHDFAMKMADIKPSQKNWAKNMGMYLEKALSAITFAEANCHEFAMEYIKTEGTRVTKSSLSVFLENVGLNNVRVCFVTATV